MKVAITAVGLVSPLGHTPAELHERLVAGETALTPVSGLEEAPFCTILGAQVTGFKARAHVQNRKNIKLMSPAVRFGMGAIDRAVKALDLPSLGLSPDRVGVYVGAGTAFGETEGLLPAIRAASETDEFDTVAFGREAMNSVSPLWLLKGLSNNVLGFSTAQIDARGANQNYSASGIGGLQALGEGAWALIEGRAELIFAGAADSAVDMGHFSGFGRLGALSEGGTPRPFDERHDGFVPGEGAAFFALERLEHARSAGRTPLATIAGYADGCAGHALSANDPEVMARTFRRALDHAGWAPNDVDVIFAHGSGTPAFDRNEAEALRMVFGTPTPAVTTLKPQIGHAVAASPALAVAVALESARTDLLPGIHGLEQPARDAHGLDLVSEPRRGPIRRALIHAAGLGGQTAALALEFTRK